MASESESLSGNTDDQAERGELRIRRPGGEWEVLQARKRHTDDPELDALWNKSLNELEAIIDDPHDPRRNKAQAVVGSTAEALREVARQATAPVLAQVQESVRRIAGNLVAPMPMPKGDPAWIKAIQQAPVAPAADSTIYEVRPSTKADSVRTAVEDVVAVLQEMQDEAREQREQDRAQAEEDRVENRIDRKRTHRVAVMAAAATALGVVVAIVIAVLANGGSSRTSSASCAQILEPWRAFTEYTSSSARTDAGVVERRGELLVQWRATASADLPDWTNMALAGAIRGFQSFHEGDTAAYTVASSQVDLIRDQCAVDGNL